MSGAISRRTGLPAFLTDSHGLAETQEADHFLPDAQRGIPREYQEVRLGRSAYSPPFQPATGYIQRAFAQIVETARTLRPVQSAFYLVGRIPYLQVFANGNKRTARLAANLPLLQAGLLPISFVDFKKADYVLGMAGPLKLRIRVVTLGRAALPLKVAAASAAGGGASSLCRCARSLGVVHRPINESMIHRCRAYELRHIKALNFILPKYNAISNTRTIAFAAWKRAPPPL